MGDLDKTSIVILVCVLTAAVITICLIAIIVYRKKWCRKSEDQPEISGSISLSDIHEYKDEDELKGLAGDIDDEQLRVHSSSDANGSSDLHPGDELKGLTGYIDDKQLHVHSSSDANGARGPNIWSRLRVIEGTYTDYICSYNSKLIKVVDDKLPVATVPPMPPPPPDPPNPNI